MIERADTRPLTVTVRASNKKTANSTCALQMVRLLYKEGLIEKFGEKRARSFFKNLAGRGIFFPK